MLLVIAYFVGIQIEFSSLSIDGDLIDCTIDTQNFQTLHVGCIRGVPHNHIRFEGLVGEAEFQQAIKVVVNGVCKKKAFVSFPRLFS